MTQEGARIEDRPSTLDAHGLLDWARRCVEHLATHREQINALNVFPVADADTGTNLLYTMRAAVERAEGELAGSPRAEAAPAPGRSRWPWAWGGARRAR